MGKVFPAVGDVSHFVQYGKALATQGRLDVLSALWSLGPQLLAAWSMKMGWMPQNVLQATTVVFGVFSVTGVYALAMELTRRRNVAIVSGLIVATNPVMSMLAATGFSDTPHFALGTWVLALIFAGARTRRVKFFVLSAFLASIDLYFRTYDLFLYLAAATPFLFWRLRGCAWKQIAKLIGAGAFAGVVFALPFFVLTNAILGWDPGQSKLVNVALGDSGANAKELYSALSIDGNKAAFMQRMDELSQDGIVRYLWAHKAEIACRWPRNIVQGLRVLNEHVFTGMFRMGLFWFLICGILCARGMREGVGWYMWGSIGVVIGAISLGFVNHRWIIQCVPFYAILAGGGCDWMVSRLSGRRLQWIAWGGLLMMGFLNGRWAVMRLDDEWRQRNLFPVCERLHKWMGEDERLMCFRPELPALFYRTDPLNWDNIPYDSVEGVFALAEVRGADCIVLDDSVLPYFPIHEIERHPEMLPVPWTEIDRMEFEKETRFGLERNVYRFYRRDVAGNL